MNPPTHWFPLLRMGREHLPNPDLNRSHEPNRPRPRNQIGRSRTSSRTRTRTRTKGRFMSASAPQTGNFPGFALASAPDSI